MFYLPASTFLLYRLPRSVAGSRAGARCLKGRLRGAVDQGKSRRAGSNIFDVQPETPFFNLVLEARPLVRFETDDRRKGSHNKRSLAEPGATVVAHPPIVSRDGMARRTLKAAGA